MKRKIMTLLVTLCLALALFPPVPVVAAAPVNVTINGVPVQFGNGSGEPFVDAAGRTQVPLRAAMEAMGADVGWNNYDRAASVVRGNKCVIVPIGQNLVYVNGVEKKNDTEAQIKDGRTYLPIRIVAESLGATVDWIGGSRTVSIQVGEPIGSPNIPDLYQMVGKPLSSIYSILGYNCTTEILPELSIAGGVWYEEYSIGFLLDSWKAGIDAKNMNTYYNPQNIVVGVVSTNDSPVWGNLHGQMTLLEIKESIDWKAYILNDEGTSDTGWNISFSAMDQEHFIEELYLIGYLWDSDTYPGSYTKPYAVSIIDWGYIYKMAELT